ncbi:MAG: BF3164 family lipoprotein [Chryseolinea sp.]
MFTAALKYRILSVVLVLMLGCSSRNDFDAYFPEKVVLKSDNVVPVKEVYLKFPMMYNVTDTSLMVAAAAMNLSSGKHLAYLISKNTGKVLKELGEGGRGPQEIMTVNNLSGYGKLITAYDGTTRKILKYDPYTDSAWVQNLNFKQKFSYRNACLVSENKVFSYGQFGGNMFGASDLITGDEHFDVPQPELPDLSKDQQAALSLAKSYAYAGRIIKHPTADKFAFYGLLAGYFQIVELNGSAIKPIMKWDFAPPKGKIVFKVDAYVWGSDKTATFRFLDGTSSEKYLYLLYSGKTNENDDSMNRSKYVFVLDWEGKRVRLIELDEDAYCIAVDRKDKTLFALSTNQTSLEHEVRRFPL